MSELIDGRVTRYQPTGQSPYRPHPLNAKVYKVPDGMWCASMPTDAEGCTDGFYRTYMETWAGAMWMLGPGYFKEPPL